MAARVENRIGAVEADGGRDRQEQTERHVHCLLGRLCRAFLALSVRNFPARVREIGTGLAPGTPVEVWFQDGMRVGQKGTPTRVWAETGSRPSAPRSDGYRSVYLFGAVCPSRDLGCALILPRCDTAAMTLFLDELSGHVVPGAHAILVLDGAGWHTAKDLRWPGHATPLPLLAYKQGRDERPERVGDERLGHPARLAAMLLT